MGDAKEIKVLPYGGNGGGPFDFHNIKRIDIQTSDEGLESIAFTNEHNAQLKIGGGRSIPTISNAIVIDHTVEYLTGIRGTIGIQGGVKVVRSIQFYTNQVASYGPYGKEDTIPFSFRQTGGEISGFHGKSGTLVDSIGVYLNALPKELDTTTQVGSS